MFDTCWALGLEGAGEAFKLRREVFIEELNKSEQAVFDENDAVSAHLIVRLDGVPIASSRMHPHEGGVLIDSMCVRKIHRGQGFGDLLVRVMLDKARRMGTPKVYVKAEGEAMAYYRAFGFAELGGLMAVDPEKIDWHPKCGDK